MSDFSQQQAVYDHFTDAANQISNQLEVSRGNSEKKAGLWEWSGWGAAIVGFIIIIIGLIIVFLRKDNAGWFATLVRLVPEAVSALFFVQSNLANQRVDKIQAN